MPNPWVPLILAKQIATDTVASGTYQPIPTGVADPDGYGVIFVKPGIPTDAQIAGWKIPCNDILNYIAPQFGDLSNSLPNATVIGIQKIAVPVPAGTNTVLTYNSGSYSWSSPFISNPIQTGSLTLSSGTKTVHTVVSITASSNVFLQLTIPSGTLGANYKVAITATGGPGTGSFAATAVDTSGATVTTDNSTLSFLIVG